MCSPAAHVQHLLLRAAAMLVLRNAQFLLHLHLVLLHLLPRQVCHAQATELLRGASCHSSYAWA